MLRLMTELFPICRSITGDGVRQTLQRIAENIPVERHEVATGTRVFDWEIPPEWNIREAWIADAAGRRVVDFADHTLHILNYSVPFRGRLPWSELRKRLYTIPGHPEWIPYRTSYYSENWGFCLAHDLYVALEARGEDAEYDICVDSTLKPGSLTYGECVLPGATDDEILLSCHICHPSLANDNLSGIAVAVEAARVLLQTERRHTIRLLFIPGTIGSITWLARNENRTSRIRHGLVLTCLGDPGRSTYKRTRRGRADVDRAVEHVLRYSGSPYAIERFIPYGYDERQYNSPGFDLPVGSLMRTPNGRYPEYHTSADNLDLVTVEALLDSLKKLLGAIDILDGNRTYRNLSPKGEPRLGKRGLYRPIGGEMGPGDFDQMALLWVLNLSDGAHSLLDIAERAEMPFDQIRSAAVALAEAALLEEV